MAVALPKSQQARQQDRLNRGGTSQFGQQRRVNIDSLKLGQIKNIFGERFRDWVSWDCPIYGKRNLIPYDDNRPEVVKHTFIAGGYWVAKKYVMEKEPINENIFIGGIYIPEEDKYITDISQIKDKTIIPHNDVEWSVRIREKYKYVMNPYSTVRHIRVKFTGDEQFVGRTNCPESIRYI